MYFTCVIGNIQDWKCQTVMNSFNLFAKWQCGSVWIIALLGKSFYDCVNYHVNRAERFFSKADFSLFSIMLVWKENGKKGVQTTIMLYRNSCCNGLCCSEVQV